MNPDADIPCLKGREYVERCVLVGLIFGHQSSETISTSTWNALPSECRITTKHCGFGSTLRLAKINNVWKKVIVKRS